MAENKEGGGFFRKVVRFVANPSTDWADLGTKQDDTREFDLEKSELKAMVERKRRNDFVRKREFDMLRKVRREGLSPNNWPRWVARRGSTTPRHASPRTPAPGPRAASRRRSTRSSNRWSEEAFLLWPTHHGLLQRPDRACGAGPFGPTDIVGRRASGRRVPGSTGVAAAARPGHRPGARAGGSLQRARAVAAGTTVARDHR